jgi:hypothetical protein
MLSLSLIKSSLKTTRNNLKNQVTKLTEIIDDQNDTESFEDCLA